MTDREKVLKALEHHKETAVCNGCPYAGDNDTPQGNCPVYDDALALLREQEPVEPHVEHDNDDDSWYYGCGACHEAIDYKDKFCRHCGKAVKWDADLQTQ